MNSLTPQAKMLELGQIILLGVLNVKVSEEEMRLW
jgi:hypothetical protein